MALKICCNLNSTYDVANPEYGLPGSETQGPPASGESPTYEPCKFGNGMLSDASRGNTYPEGVSFHFGGNGLSNAKGTLEAWVKAKWGSYTGSKFLLGNWWYQTPFKTCLFVIKRSGEVQFAVMEPYGIDWKYVIYAHAYNVSWPDGVKRHIALVWDNQGGDIGGGKTIALFVDGARITPSHFSYGNDETTWAAGTAPAALTLGFKQTTGADDQAHARAVIDQFKAYDHCKTSFPSIEFEDCIYAPPGPKIRVPTDLWCEQKTNPTDVVDPQPEFSAIYHDP